MPKPSLRAADAPIAWPHRALRFTRTRQAPDPQGSGARPRAALRLLPKVMPLPLEARRLARHGRLLTFRAMHMLVWIMRMTLKDMRRAPTAKRVTQIVIRMAPSARRIAEHGMRLPHRVRRLPSKIRRMGLSGRR